MGDTVNAMEASQRRDDLIEIKIKVLEYQIYTLQVDKRVLICSLKEKIASVSGVIPKQQRLIFRGRALKDARHLSDYLAEDGHTLQLLARPPKPESAADSSSLSGDDRLDSCGSYTESSVDPTVASKMPDSLTTLSGDLNHLRREFAAYVNNLQTMSMEDEQVSGENWQRRPSHLVELLQRTRQLLTGDVAELLSNISELLVDHVNVMEPSSRTLHQGRVLSAGTNLFLLGDSLMDLGQTTMMLHFGETPEDAFVDVGSPFIMQNRSQLPNAQLGGEENSDSGGIITSRSEQNVKVASAEAQNAVNSSATGLSAETNEAAVGNEGIEETQIVHPSQDEAFIIASTSEEMLHWYRERVVWTEESLVLKLLRKGILTRIYTPMVIIQELKEAGVFSSVTSAHMSFSRNRNNSSTSSITRESSQATARKVLEFDLDSESQVSALPPQSSPGLTKETIQNV